MPGQAHWCMQRRALPSWTKPRPCVEEQRCPTMSDTLSGHNNAIRSLPLLVRRQPAQGKGFPTLLRLSLLYCGITLLYFTSTRSELFLSHGPLFIANAQPSSNTSLSARHRSVVCLSLAPDRGLENLLRPIPDLTITHGNSCIVLRQRIARQCRLLTLRGIDYRTVGWLVTLRSAITVSSL